MPPTTPLERLAYTVTETATICGVSPRTIYKMIASGELESVVLARRTRRIPVTAIHALLATSKAQIELDEAA